MTTYSTGNPVGSPDPRDLYDNAENLDNAANSDDATWTDRLGVERRTLSGIDEYVEQAVTNAGYDYVGDYAAGIELAAYNQIVRDTSGEFWRVSGSETLPYTLTGTGVPEGGALVSVGDAALRQELADGTAEVSSSTGTQTIAEALNSRVIYADTIADLQALSVLNLSAHQGAQITTTGRSGSFTWMTGNQSANVSNDPESGVWVAPNSDPTGASGAWQRQYDTWHVDPRWFGAQIDGVTVDNTAMQASMDWSLGVSLPPDSVMVIDPSNSLIVRQGHNIRGWGQDSSVIYCTEAGGSVFKRIDPSVDSDYVRNVVFEGIAIVFRHPATADPANYHQIGFDMRSLTRSQLNNCYAGNYPRGPLRATLAEPAQADARQGYGVMIATDLNGTYSGGEVNTVDTCQFYGCRNAVDIDNPDFVAVASAAYGTYVRNCDIQIVEKGITQFQEFNAGCAYIDNVVQAVGQMRGSTKTRECYRIEGRSCRLVNRYIEVVNADIDAIITLGNSSQGNVIDLNLIGNDDAFIAKILDGNPAGGNIIRYHVPSTDRYVETEGRENMRIKAKVTFNATGVIQGDSFNVSSVSRVATGDFIINFADSLGDADYQWNAGLQLDTGGSGAICAARSKASSSLRIVTRNASGAVADMLETTVTVY